MNYQSFLFGCILLALALTFVYLFYERKRGTTIYPMVELYIALIVGVIYSVVAVCVSTDWPYLIRVFSGLVLGIPVGWALMMLSGLFTAIINEIISSSRRSQ